MLQLIKNNSPFTVIILLILSVLLKIGVVMHPLAPMPAPGYYLYDIILKTLNVVLHDNAIVFTVLGVLLIFGQAIYINRIAARHKLFGRPTYVPAFVYIVLSSVYPPWNYFNETMLLNWCILGGMDVLLSYGQTLQPRKLIFNAGFLFCMASVIQFSAIGFFVLMMTGMFMVRRFSLGEWVVGLMGYITPIYFFIGILFLADKLPFLSSWMHFGYSVPHRVVAVFYFVWVITGFLILSICGAYAMQLQVPKSSIYIRRNWAVIVFYLIISILVAVVTDIKVQSEWLIIIPALCFVVSAGMLLEKNKGFSNFTFYFSLVFVIICQLAIK